MRPLTIITGIVLGSAFSITLGLAVVFIIFLVVGTDEPRIGAEMGQARDYAVRFAFLTGISAASFMATLKESRSRWLWQAAMWGSLALVAWLSWP